MKSQGKQVLTAVVCAFLLAGGVFFISAVLKAQSTPQLISYQGRLTDDTGLPIDGPREMRFRILDADTLSASVLWSETQSSVQVNQGIYHVLLGAVNALPPSAISQSDIYLEVIIAGEILLPRSRITSVAFAHKAASVPDGAITSAMIQDGEISSDDVGFNYADSSSKGGPATDVSCTDCVDSTEVQFNYAGSSAEGGAATSALDLSCADCLNAAEIEDIYVLNTGDEITGALKVDQGSILVGPTQAVFASWDGDPVDHYAYLASEDHGVYALCGDSDESADRYGGTFRGESLTAAYGVRGQGMGYGSALAEGVRGYGENSGDGEVHGAWLITGVNGTGVHIGALAEGRANSASATYGVKGIAYNNLTGPVYGGHFSAQTSGTGLHYGVWASGNTYAGWFQDGRVHVGDAGTQNYLNGDGDLYVEDALEVDGNLYSKGNLWLHANEGYGSDGTAYIQARDNSGTSSISMQIRTQNAGTINNAALIKNSGIVHVGSTGTEDHVDGNGDLYVQDELEVDGDLYVQNKLEVNGNSYAGEYYYNANKTRYYHVPRNGIPAVSTMYDSFFPYQGYSECKDGLYCATLFPVNLPERAVVTAFRLWGATDSTSHDFSCLLFYNSHTSGATTMASISSTNTNMTLADTSVEYSSIDNQNYSYSVMCLEMVSSRGADLEIYGIRIDYTIDGPE